MTPPTIIERLFQDLTDDEPKDLSLLASWGGFRGPGWSDLLKARRVLIVSEAGVGKTYECRACQQRLWEKGEAAFFLELATLADTDVSEMLSPEEQIRFSYNAFGDFY